MHSITNDFPRMNIFVFELIITALCITEFNSSVALDFIILVLHLGFVQMAFPDKDT